MTNAHRARRTGLCRAYRNLPEQAGPRCETLDRLNGVVASMVGKRLIYRELVGDLRREPRRTEESAGAKWSSTGDRHDTCHPDHSREGFGMSTLEAPVGASPRSQQGRRDQSADPSAPACEIPGGPTARPEGEDGLRVRHLFSHKCRPLSLSGRQREEMMAAFEEFDRSR